MVAAPSVPPVADLDTAPSRDEIARIVLDYARVIAPRVAMLVVRGGALLVLDGRGIAVSEAARVSVPLSPPSSFSETVGSGKPFRGHLGGSAVERGWIERVGRVAGEALLLPIVVREKTIALLYADGWEGPLQDVPLYATAAAAGRAYERLILARKREGSAPKARPQPAAPRKPLATTSSSPPPAAAPAPAPTPRADPRYALALDCLVRHDGHTYEGESRDLSRGGLCVRLDRALPVGADVELQVALVFEENAQSEALPLAASVVWCTPLGGGGYQVGTKFGALDPETREYVDLFLRYLDAAPDDEDEELDADEAPFA